MLLDNRLRSVVNEIEDSRCTIDVGTDHGKVILTAISEGRCDKGIASDISRDSLDKARALSNRLGIPLDTRCGDGLSVVACGEADTAVIAGMGGKEIVKILSSFSGQIAKLVLVPHRDARLVRRYLADNGYAIAKDYMVLEGTFYYNIIVANIGEMVLDEDMEYLGMNDSSNEVFRGYLEYRSRVIREILSKTDNEELRHELELIERKLI